MELIFAGSQRLVITWLKRFILALGCSLLVCSQSLAWHNVTKYDLLIYRETKRYMIGVDPLLYKAQLIQESALKTHAVSPVGAMGLAQLMPGTAKDLSKQIGYTIDPFNVRHSIEAGAKYMGQLRRQWRVKRPETDRHNLALASYNAGLGNILKAQKRCGNVPLYNDIMKCLRQITGRYADETLNYAPKIRRVYHQLK